MKFYTLAFYLGRKKDNPSATWLDRIVCFFSKSPYSHVELVMDEFENANYCLCIAASPRDGGVRTASINLKSGHWHLYRVVGEDDVLEVARSHLHKKYDFFGAVCSLFDIAPARMSKMFCSKLIANCFRLENPQHYTPQELVETLSLWRIKND